jgi:hypothetical protein
MLEYCKMNRDDLRRAAIKKAKTAGLQTRHIGRQGNKEMLVAYLEHGTWPEIWGEQKPRKNNHRPLTVTGEPVKEPLLAMKFSIFSSKTDTAAKYRTLSILEFITLLSEHRVRQQKDGTLFAPATFNGTRKKDNFISASGICIDFDHGTPTIEQALELFHGTLAAYYSTHSHTPDNPRFRVVIPLSRPVNADEHAQLVLGIKRTITPELMECIDTTCFERARAHYLPSCPPSHNKHAFSGHQDGNPLDVDHFISIGNITAGVPEPAPARYEFTDSSTGEIYDLTAWAAKNPQFDILTAVNHQFHRGKPKDGKQHIQCPYEDKHSDQGQDLATFIANASPDHPTFTIHCCHAHCEGRDRLEFLRVMLEKGWMVIEPLQVPVTAPMELKRPPNIYFPVNDILAAPEWSTLNSDEYRIALHLTTLAWSTDDGTIPDDSWMLSRRMGISESEWSAYRNTLIKTGWLIVANGKLTNSIIKRQFDKAQAAYMTAIAKAANGGRSTQEKARFKRLLEAPA